MFEFIWPQSIGEWLAWSAALFSVVGGLITFLMPRVWLKSAKLRTAANHPNAISEVRGPIAGGTIGLGLVVLLFHPQPLLYLAFGGTWAFSALGRFISIFVDKGNNRHNWGFFVTEVNLAALPLLYALGYVR